MNKNRMLYFVLAILTGLFMFIYCGIDDSPGGQVLSLLLIAIGIIGIYKKYGQRYK